MEPPFAASLSHKALHNSDVLRLILDHLSVTRDGRELASLACVCKAFSEHALNLLWKSLPCIVPLLDLLSVEREDNVLSLKGTISDEDWLRFRHYSHRIRKLKAACPSHNHVFHPSIYSELSREAEKQPLVPYLRQLVCPYSLFSVLASGCLVVLGIMSIEPRTTLDQVLDAVTSDSPYLHCLILNSRASATLESSTLATVERLKELRTLRLAEPVSAHCVSALAALPNLKDLSIPLDAGMMDDLATTAQFPALERLTIRDGSISSVMHILRAAVNSPFLKSLAIGDDFRPFVLAPRNWRMFWQRLGAVLVPGHVPSLRRLNIQCRNETSTEVSPNVATLMDLIQPLLALSQLEEVLLFCGGLRLNISVDDVRAMAAAWTHLVELDLVLDMLNRASVSVQSLIAFAMQCPRLQTLKVCLLNLAALNADEVETIPILSHGLKTLSLYSHWSGWSMAQKMQCARLLDRSFPNIKECLCAGDAHLPRVSDLLLAFQSVRREQMVRVGSIME